MIAAVEFNAVWGHAQGDADGNSAIASRAVGAVGGRGALRALDSRSHGPVPFAVAKALERRIRRSPGSRCTQQRCGRRATYRRAESPRFRPGREDQGTVSLLYPAALEP